MSLELIKKRSISPLGIFLAALFLFSLGSGPVSASSNSPIVVQLSINGGQNANILNNESVELVWYIDGNVSNCTIVTVQDNTVVVPASEIPIVGVNTPVAQGSKTVTPPPDVVTNYRLACVGGQSDVTASPVPEVTFSFPDGSTFAANPATGRVPSSAGTSIRVEWDSESANQCYDLYYTKQSSPQTKISITPGQTSLEGDVTIGSAGEVTYLTETSTFYITCRNTASGVETVGSGTINVTQTAPPADITVNVFGDDVAVRDVETVWAYTDVSWTSTGAATCSASAKKVATGANYPDREPVGWFSQSETSNTRRDIRLNEATDFTITCTRPAITVGGVFYPAVSASDTHRVSVASPNGWSEDPNSWPVGARPQVTASISVNSDIIYRDLNGVASVQVSAVQTNAEYCMQSNTKADGTPYNTNIGQPYPYAWWDRVADGNRSSLVRFIPESTRFVWDCQREWDVLYGDEAAKARGRAVAEVIVTVEDSLISTEPEAYMYAHAVSYTPNGISSTKNLFSIANSVVGFQSGSIGGGGSYLPQFRNTAGATGVINSLTWKFDHPLKGNARHYFDVILNVCDIDYNDAKSEYKIYVNGILQGAYITDQDPVGNSCDGDDDRLSWVRLASDISIGHGEDIRLECVEIIDGENCSFASINFGVDGVVMTEPPDSGGQVKVSLGWFSENSTTCDLLDYTPPQPRNEVARTAFDINLTESEEISVRCGRPFDNKYAVGTVDLRVPPPGLLFSDVLTAAGTCIDPNTLISGPAQPGWGAGPSGLCVLLLDLGIQATGLSANGVVDNRTGLYTNPTVTLTILNIKNSQYGTPDVPEGNKSYKVYQVRPDQAVKEAYESYGVTVFDDELESAVGNYYQGFGVRDSDESSLVSDSRSIEVEGEMMFGKNIHVCVRVNLDGDNASPPWQNMPEVDSSEESNTKCSTNFTLDVPRPPMDITASRNVVRYGEPVDITWEVDVEYNLECRVRGAEIDKKFTTLFLTDGFDSPVLDGYSGTATILLTKTSRFVLTCTEPITNTSFTEDVTVEVIPEHSEV